MAIGTVIASAILGGLLTYTLQTWKLHFDEGSARSDEICKLLLELGLASSEYWSNSYINLDDTEIPNSEQVRLEGKILGYQNLLDGLAEDFRDRLSLQKAEELDQYLSECLDMFTGGRFTESGRSIDIERCRGAIASASLLAIFVRRCSRSSIPFSTMISNIRENRKRPRLDEHLRK